ISRAPVDPLLGQLTGLEDRARFDHIGLLFNLANRISDLDELAFRRKHVATAEHRRACANASVEISGANASRAALASANFCTSPSYLACKFVSRSATPLLSASSARFSASTAAV